MALSAGYFKTSYKKDVAIVETYRRWFFLIVLLLALLGLPALASPFVLDLANQILLTLIGAIALMILTGFAGQISLGHGGLIAAGAFTTAILFKEFGASIVITLPASALVGAILGLVFGLPSVRMRGLYLALSTLALYFVVSYIGGEYETQRGGASGVIVSSPTLGQLTLSDARLWYLLFLLANMIVVVFSLNLIRSRVGRAWMAIRSRDIVAESIGVNVSLYKLMAFIVSSVMTSTAGCLTAYYRGFVSVEAFSFFLSIEYIAIIIIGGLGTILGAIFGTIFVVLLPYLIDAIVNLFNVSPRFTTYLFAIKQASFGFFMMIFLILEPDGLIGIWRRVRDYFVLWPFRHKTLGS